MGSGLGAGLAQGLSSGAQLVNQKKYADMYEKESQRQDRTENRKDQEHQIAMEDRAALKRAFSRIGPEVLFRTDGSGQQAGTQESLAFKPLSERPDYGMGAIKGYAQGGMIQIPDEAFAQAGLGAPTQGPAAGPGLASVSQKQPAATQQTDPRQEMSRQMLTGNLLEDPEKLTAIANIFQEEGLGDRMIPWLQQAYEAKKKGMVSGAMKLIQGNVDDAIDDLGRGGMKLADRPVKVNPDDPSDHRWKINIDGVGEQVMDVGNLLGSTLDPEKFMTMQLKQKELAAKQPENEADVDLKKAQAEYYRGAKTGLAQAQAARAGRSGDSGGGGRADRPEKIDAAVKRRDSIIDDLSSTTGDDGKPFVDPKKRMQYSSLAVDVEEAITERLDRDLTAKEHHKLTDLLRTAPLGDAQGMEQWGAQVERTFGGGGKESSPQKPAQKQAAPVAQPNAAPLGGNAQPQPRGQPQAPARAGGLQGLKEQQELRNQMNAIQQALKNPNLSTQQKQNLALQANEIQKRTEAYYRGR